MYFTQITPPLTNSALPCSHIPKGGRHAQSPRRFWRPLFHPESADATARHRSAPLAAPTLAALSDGGRVCARVQRVKRLGAVLEGQPALHYAA